jgi:adenosine/AMP kinase
MQLVSVRIEKPKAAYFIQTVEDIHEALVAAVPGIMQFHLLKGSARGTQDSEGPVP